MVINTGASLVLTAIVKRFHNSFFDGQVISFPDNSFARFMQTDRRECSAYSHR